MVINVYLIFHVCVGQDGDKFWRMPECYIRGSTIKYLRIPDEVIDMVKEEVIQQRSKGRGEGRGGRGGLRGRGGPGRGQIKWCFVLILEPRFCCYPTTVKGCQDIVFTHGVRMGGRREKVCPGYISETVRCRKLILGRDIG